MDRTVVLVHAPLLGPSSWRWVAGELRDRGIDVEVPDLHAAVGSRRPAAYVTAIADVVRDRTNTALVGHSGAGPLLPSAAAEAGLDERDVGYVFVDAAIPPPDEALPTSPELRAQLEALVGDDGVLPPWHTWWGPDAMAWLVPDAERRAAVTVDVPRLPLAYFDDDVVAPADWQQRAAAGFVRLSEVYRPYATTAAERGWPVVEVPGTHLAPVNEPAAVADAILEVLGSSWPRYTSGGIDFGTPTAG